MFISTSTCGLDFFAQFSDCLLESVVENKMDQLTDCLLVECWEMADITFESHHLQTTHKSHEESRERGISCMYT